jgi:spore coat protein U-like protein
MNRPAIRIALLVAALVALAGPARAQCTISATPLSFGNYDVFSATPLDSTSTLTVQCNYILHSITVTLSTGSSPTYAARTLQHGSDTLVYNIYRTADRSTIWGDGIAGGTTNYSGYIWFFQTLTLTLYGRIPAAQDACAGAYTDTIQAIVNY